MANNLTYLCHEEKIRVVRKSERRETKKLSGEKEEEERGREEEGDDILTYGMLIRVIEGMQRGANAPINRLRRADDLAFTMDGALTPRTRWFAR